MRAIYGGGTYNQLPEITPIPAISQPDSSGSVTVSLPPTQQAVVNNANSIIAADNSIISNSNTEIQQANAAGSAAGNATATTAPSISTKNVEIIIIISAIAAAVLGIAVYVMGRN